MRRGAAKPNRTMKILAWVAGSILALGAIVYIGGNIWLSRYLRSAEFRRKIEERAGITMRAEVKASPQQFEGTQFYSGGFEARGTKEASFSKITVENIRGEYQIPSFLRLLMGDRKVSADNIEVQRVNAEFLPGDRLDLDLPAREPGPHNVEVKRVNVREIRALWSNWELTGAAARINAVEGGWKAEGETGKLVTDWGLPAFDLTSARVVYKEAERSIIIQEARARAAGGEVTATGEAAFSKELGLLIHAKDVNVTPLLPEDWRARLHGKLEGEAKLRTPLVGADTGMFTLAGNVSLKQGTLEALPILHKIADYTKTDQFRHVPIDQLTGDFTYERKGKSLKVTNFVLESRQLIRITGAFNIIDGEIDGAFAVGITPSPLKWLPGAEERVFTVQSGGYAWTRMRLSGQASSPKEDLSGRLVMAAGGAVVDKVEETATKAADKAIDTGKKAAAGVFDLLFGGEK
jgi:hypothetical protein